MPTVLLVEDERDIAELVRYHVEKAGMRYVGPARYYELDLVKYVANERR